MTLTAEQIATAEQIVAYAQEKLRGIELRHEASPREIFGELLGQLVAAEYKAQAADATSRQLRELIGAIWGDAMPEGADRAATVERAAQCREIARQVVAGEFVRPPEPAPEEKPEPSHFAGALEGAETEEENQ